MIQLFIGIATFPCCGEPHLIYAGAEDEAACRAQFAATLDEAAQFRNGPATSSMFVEVGLLQLVQMTQLVQAAMEEAAPKPEVHVVRVQSREQLDALLDAIGAKKSDADETPTPTHDAPSTPQ